MNTYVNPSLIRGEVRGYEVCDGIWQPRLRQPNLIMDSWADIVGSLLRGDVSHRIGGMYFEFTNNYNPGTHVNPTYASDDTRDYYDTLSSHPNRDYLRVPLISSTDMVPDDNQVLSLTRFFAMTSGEAVGVHGKPFTLGATSAVIGVALVSVPNADDRTQDLLFSRTYFAANAGLPKLATGQIGVEWRIALSAPTP